LPRKAEKSTSLVAIDDVAKLIGPRMRKDRIEDEDDDEDEDEQPED